MTPRFLIKFGEEHHLQQIIDGKIRFAPSQVYIKLEEALHNKGQGDLLEGKLKIKTENARLHNPDTDELVGILPQGSTIIVSIQDVNDMPVFCISQFNDESISEFVDDTNYTISISPEKIDSIQADFPKATHALLILEPDKFIGAVKSIDGHSFVSDSIHYYDYDINPLQMYMFLCTGTETIKTNSVISLTYENRYRHLLCKDTSFSNQEEYRFIQTDELHAHPVFYPIRFTTKYMLIPIAELKNSIRISF